MYLNLILSVLLMRHGFIFKIHDVTDCNLLQQYVKHVYYGETTNNMFLMPTSYIILPSVLKNLPV